MKVKGIPRDDGGKDYLISHNGQQHQATRNGSLFCCNGVTDTLRNIKKMIQGGELAVRQPTTNLFGGVIQIHDETKEIREEFENIRKRIQGDESAVRQQPTNNSDGEPNIDVGLWDCVHPCALLVLTVHELNLPEDVRVKTMETLDNYGWLTECGSPDYERATRDYQLNERQ